MAAVWRRQCWGLIDADAMLSNCLFQARVNSGFPSLSHMRARIEIYNRFSGSVQAHL